MTLSASLDADFSAMCTDVPLYIGDVLQNVRVDVDEEGRLVVRTDSGEVHVFTGEVSVHGIYGAV